MRQTGNPQTDSSGNTPAALLDLLDGFRRTKVLATAVRLRLFDLLADRGALSTAEATTALGLAERPTHMLLTACCSLGLLDRDAGTERYRNSAQAQQFLVSTARHYLGGFIQLVEEQQYPGWEDLLTAIRENRPTVWDPASRPTKFAVDDATGEVELFWNAMASVSSSIAEVVVHAYDFSPFRRLLDVGGGPGELGMRLCQLNPRMRATIYDLPAVCELTALRLKDRGLDDRLRTVGGDLLTDDELPLGHDLVTLTNVLHMWDERTNETILRKCHAALDDEGVLVIAEAFVDDAGTGPQPAALMSLNMLVDTVGGANHSRAAYESMLARAGFSTVRRVPVAADAPVGVNGLLVARKSERPGHA